MCGMRTDRNRWLVPACVALLAIAFAAAAIAGPVPTFADGQTLTAGQLNALRDAVEALKAPRPLECSVVLSGFHSSATAGGAAQATCPSGYTMTGCACDGTIDTPAWANFVGAIANQPPGACACVRAGGSASSMVRSQAVCCRTPELP